MITFTYGKAKVKHENSSTSTRKYFFFLNFTGKDFEIDTKSFHGLRNIDDFSLRSKKISP